MSTAPLVDIPRSAEAGMSLLRKGIPLSLLLDLAFGPNSEELLARELETLPTQRPPAA